MMKHITQTWQLRRFVLTVVLLATAAGCSSTNLGNIDETDDPRETMPGPSILADEQGESPLTLKTGADKEAATAVAVSAPAMGEKAEFEQFKKWDNLRTNQADSAEYQEFLEWIKYQQFKAGQ
jgi:hypothetical protein